MLPVIALAILPALILIYYTYQQDKLQREPVGNLVKAFFYGGLSVFVSLLISVPLMQMGFFSAQIHTLKDAAATAFFGAAIPEESAKLFLLWLFLRKCRDFDERMDGIVYAVCVSLGFAALENVLYVMQYGFGTALIRAFTSVPGHCFFGVYMGYWYGKAKHARYYGLPGSGTCLALSFIIPTLLHGFYDFCCFMSGNGLFIAIFYAFLIAFFIAAIRCVKKASAEDVPIAPSAEQGF